MSRRMALFLSTVISVFVLVIGIAVTTGVLATGSAATSSTVSAQGVSAPALPVDQGVLAPQSAARSRGQDAILTPRASGSGETEARRDSRGRDDQRVTSARRTERGGRDGDDD